MQRNSETARYPRVNLWLAYPNYGIGYLMSNGRVGELMPDKTSLFYSADYRRILYNSANLEELDYYTAQNGNKVVPRALFPSGRAVQTKSLEEFSIHDFSKDEIQSLLPSDIYKKFRLLKRFKHEFKHRIRKDR